MNMLLLDSYTFGNRKADVFQIKEGYFRVDCYENGRIFNTVTSFNIIEAKRVAENFTDGKSSQLLNENV
jgi:ribosomal protein L9